MRGSEKTISSGSGGEMVRSPSLQPLTVVILEEQYEYNFHEQKC